MPVIKENLVSIVIVNWNSEKYIKNCLNSIKSQIYNRIELIVIDNNSTDGSLKYIEQSFPWSVRIKNKKNIGFSKAQNQGISLSRGEFVLPLNFDVFIEPNFVEEMVKFIKINPDTGLISGKLLKQINGQKSKIIDSTGIMMKLCFMSPRGENEEDKGQYDNSNHIIFGACGAAPFYRRKMLEDIKYLNEYFDEDFVNYVEDVDLSWRANLRGWKCLYNPKAVAFHERGVTRKYNKKIQDKYLTYGFRNRYCCMIKNITKSYWNNHKHKIVYNEIMFLLSPLRDKPRIIKTKAFLLSIWLFIRMLKKRKYIQTRKLITENQVNDFLGYKTVDLNKRLSESLSPKLRDFIVKFRIIKA